LTPFHNNIEIPGFKEWGIHVTSGIGSGGLADVVHLDRVIIPIERKARKRQNMNICDFVRELLNRKTNWYCLKLQEVLCNNSRLHLPSNASNPIHETLSILNPNSLQ
jgi:hypothetical protein